MEEVYFEEEIRKRVIIEGNELLFEAEIRDIGYGVRIARNGKLGFGFAPSLEEARKIAKANMIKKFRGFPEMSKGKELYFKLPSLEKIADKAFELANELGELAKISLEAIEIKRAIERQERFEEKQSWVIWHISLQGKNHVARSFIFRKFCLPSIEELIELSRLEQEKLSKNLPLVISPEAQAYILERLLLPNLLERNKEKSFFIRHRVKARIWQKLNLFTRAFDREGVKPREIELVNNDKVNFIGTFEEVGKSLGCAFGRYSDEPFAWFHDVEISLPYSEMPYKHVLVKRVSGKGFDLSSGNFSVLITEAYSLPEKKALKPFKLVSNLSNLLNSSFVGEKVQANRFITAPMLIEA